MSISSSQVLGLETCATMLVFFVFVFKLFCLIIKVSGQSRPFHSTRFSNSSLVILLLRLPPGGKGDQRV